MDERMSREEAIAYLERKGQLSDPVKPGTSAKYSKPDEDQIARVEKEGRICGDPVANIQ